MNNPVTFDPNGIYARASSTCDRRGAAFEVFAPRPRFWRSIASLCLQCIGAASFLFIAFGLIATFGSVA